jgi:hypothetical protein
MLGCCRLMNLKSAYLRVMATFVGLSLEPFSLGSGWRVSSQRSSLSDDNINVFGWISCVEEQRRMAAVGVPAPGAIGVKPVVAVKQEAVAGNHTCSASGASAGASRAEEMTDREIMAMEHAIGKLEGLKTHLAKDVCAKATVDALGDIVDEMCIDVCVEVHRWHRLGMLVFDSVDTKDAANRVVDVAGYDVHGQVKPPLSPHHNLPLPLLLSYYAAFHPRSPGAPSPHGALLRPCVNPRRLDQGAS